MMSRKSKAQKAGHPASGGLGFAAHTLRKVREAWDTPCVYDVKEIKSPTVWAPGGTRRFMADVNPTIDQVLSSLQHEVIYGRAYLTIAVGLAEVDSVVFDSAPAFFGLTREAHLLMSQMCAARLYDKTNGTVTVNFLLSEAETKRGTFKNGSATQVCSVLGNAKTRIAGLEPVLISIRKRRNEGIAHLDRATVMDPSGLAERAKLSIKDLEQVFSTTASILNELQVLWEDSCSTLEFTNADDFKHALKLIADAKHAQADKYETKFKTPCPFPRPQTPRSSW